MRSVFPTFNDPEEKYVFRPLLIPYVILAAWIGAAYILGDPERTMTPSFDQAKELASVSNWGWMFWFGALCIGLTMWVGDSLWLRCSLFLGGVIYSWWGFLFFLGIFHVENSTLNGPVIYWFLAYTHFAASALTRRPDLS